VVIIQIAQQITDIPIPPEGGLEGCKSWHSSVNCNGDCHLLIHDLDSGLLWESWDTSIGYDAEKDTVVNVSATCLTIWNTSHLYPQNGRGDGCTSADAAGFPISTLLFTADEVAAGEIKHAIRFILPNSRMRKGCYIHPGSHYGGPSATSDHAPVYGSRWRLRSTFNSVNYTTQAKVVIKALQTYGMLLADGGNIALTAMNDTFNSNRTWSEAGLGSHDLDDIRPTDFEVMDGFGSDAFQGPFSSLPDCVKNDIPLDVEPCCDCVHTSSPGFRVFSLLNVILSFFLRLFYNVKCFFL